MIPRVLGDAVGLSPLIVLVSVAASAVLFGGVAVLLAIPFAAVAATVVDVVVLEEGSTEEDVPAVLFPAKEAEPAGVSPLGPAPATEDQAAEGEPEPERPERERAERQRLARSRGAASGRAPPAPRP